MSTPHDAPPRPAPSPPLSEARLHAYVDGRLPAHELPGFEAALSQDAQATSTVAAWRAQREQLRALHAGGIQEALPPSLLAAAQGLQGRHDAARRAWRLGGMAASLLLVFGLGWFSHSALHPGVGGTGHQQQAGRGQQEFIRQATLAYTVYTPELRHPVEVAAAQQEHLVQWLSKRLGRPLKLPDLGPVGYTLVGGRLLPGEAGARAQFMFQDGNGERITLYVGAVSIAASGAASAAKAETQATAFQFASEAGVSSFYWVDQGFGYALAGKLPREGLLRLAEAVYAQL